MLRILTEHIEKVCGLECKLCLTSVCYIRILIILEVIPKTSFLKIEKCSTLLFHNFLLLEANQLLKGNNSIFNFFLGDEFWKSIEPYYMEGKWTYPKGRQVLAELSNDAANKALGALDFYTAVFRRYLIF